MTDNRNIIKKILITGAGSYIGTSVEKWLNNEAGKYDVNVLDMKNGEWVEYDFTGYDTVFHVAGIAHADTGKSNEDLKKLYYKVNTEMAIDTAKKAKASGVKHFILMSSIIIYGSSKSILQEKVITMETLPAPENYYGNSKLKAENGIRILESKEFLVTILRPPMIYGKGCKGNYKLMSKFARLLPIFPDFLNHRSMLYIDNLCEFIKLVIENCIDGILFPQNSEYVTTSNMVELIALAHGKKITKIKCLNRIIEFLGHVGGKIGVLINKAFGSLVYEMNMSELTQIEKDYRVYDFKKSIYLTELDK